MKRFTQLVVCQRGHRLALDVYRLSARFPSEERFGMTVQIRRAAVSVTSNIAEGSKRRTQQEYARFLNIAEGSLAETESLLLLSKDLGFAKTDGVDSLIAESDEIARMLYALRASVEASIEAAKL